LARALRPGGHDHPLVLSEQAADVTRHGAEKVSALALGSEVAPGAAAQTCNVLAIGRLEGRKQPDRMRGELRLPLVLGEEHLVGGNGLVRRCAEPGGLERIDARLVVLVDLLEASKGSLVRQMIEAQFGAGNVVEQGLEARVEQREPMLLAGKAMPGAHSL